jgi:hypothetical protein
VGEYKDDWGYAQLITPSFWNSARITDYDNSTNVIYTQNPCDAAWNPGKFSKIVYTEPASGSFYFCTIEYGLGTLEEAQASTKAADSSSPETSGCGPFPWSKATPQ